jgi:Flp pilus assembly pilin Flp
MRWILLAVHKLKTLRNELAAQDLVEYALMAGFVAVSAGATMPGVATNISTIFVKVGSILTRSSQAS